MTSDGGDCQRGVNSHGNCDAGADADGVDCRCIGVLSQIYN
jgi:hypothetical protein